MNLEGDSVSKVAKCCGLRKSSWPGELHGGWFWDLAAILPRVVTSYSVEDRVSARELSSLMVPLGLQGEAITINSHRGQETNVCLLSSWNSLFKLTSLLMTGAWLTMDSQEVNVQWMKHACRTTCLLKVQLNFNRNLLVARTTGAGRVVRKLESMPSSNFPVIKNEA